MSEKTKDEEVEQMNGKSKDVWEEKQKTLEDVLPGVLSEGEVDVEKLKKLIGEDNIARGERYNFNWAGKSDAIQEIKKRTTATLKPNKEESVNFEDTENLFIEGENLEVLRALQKAYYGKVKMIYIDPPFNTGNDFIYNDTFSESLEDYNGKTGNTDENGKMIKALQKNTKEKGHYHSNWLSMMYPRLFLAKNLLKRDGVIFVSIDDNEVHNLKMIMNEIFGEENFVANLIWTNKEGGGGSDSKYFRVKHEYVLCYAKNKSDLEIKGTDITNRDRYRKKDKHVDERGPYYLQQLNQTSIQYSESLDYIIEAPDGTELDPHKSGERACWRWSKEKVKWGIENDFIEFKDRDGKWKVYTKQYLKVDNEGNQIDRTMPPLAVVDQFSSTQATKKMKELFEGQEVFSYPKSCELIQWLSERVTDKDDLVLDFFGGSGTIAEAIFKQNVEDKGNRKFIVIQLPEKTEEDSDAKEEGFETIADIGRERIRRASEKIKEDNPEIEEGQYDFGFKAFELTDSNFRNWVKQEIEDEEELQQKLEEIIDNVKEETRKENMLYELMFKLGLNPNVELEEKDDYYRLLDGEYLISLADEIDSDLAETFLDEDPRVVVCLDKAFKGNDELKTNTALQMQSEEITFKVV